MRYKYRGNNTKMCVSFVGAGIANNTQSPDNHILRTLEYAISFLSFFLLLLLLSSTLLFP